MPDVEIRHYIASCQIEAVETHFVCDTGGRWLETSIILVPSVCVCECVWVWLAKLLKTTQQGAKIIANIQQ